VIDGPPRHLTVGALLASASCPWRRPKPNSIVPTIPTPTCRCRPTALALPQGSASTHHPPRPPRKPPPRPRLRHAASSLEMVAFTQALVRAANQRAACWREYNRPAATAAPTRPASPTGSASSSPHRATRPPRPAYDTPAFGPVKLPSPMGVFAYGISPLRTSSPVNAFRRRRPTRTRRPPPSSSILDNARERDPAALQQLAGMATSSTPPEPYLLGDRARPSAKPIPRPLALQR
jgi:hypothetical protein